MKELLEKGVGGIEFRRVIFTSELLNPLKSFSVETQTIEYRKDTLLERWTRINTSRASRVRQTEKKETFKQMFNEIVKESRESCYFCPSSLSEKTPSFPRNLIKNGRLKYETFIMFPNLFPYAKYHCVGVLSEEHYLDLNAISPELLANCLLCCKEFFKTIIANDPKAKYCSINLNYLPPAGASILHPHIQILQDYKPTTMLKWIVEASWRYLQTYKRCYWSDLIESEKMLNVRFFLKGKVTDWITAFAPLGEKEVIGICRLNVSDILNLEDNELKMFAKDISHVLSLLHSRLNVKSINLSIFNGPLNENVNKAFRLHVRIIARREPTALYANDRTFMEVIQLEPVVESLPEKVALTLRR